MAGSLAGAQLLERLLGGFLLCRLLRRTDPDAGLIAVDHRSRSELPVVRRALDVEHRVAHLAPQSRELLLELRLVVDVRRRRVFDSPAERLDDRVIDPREPMLQEQCCEGRLEKCGENVPVASETSQLLLGDDVPAFLDQPVAEAQLPRDDGAARPRDDVRADLGQPPLREVRVALVQRAGDGQLENAVAEELEPLVRGCSVSRPRRMREGVVRPRRGQLVDQPRKRARAGVGRLATGAT
jgi:hypothetical protein